METELVVEEELWTEDTRDDHEGWFCVATNPFPCPPKAAHSSPCI